MRILTCILIAAAGLAAQDSVKTPAAPARHPAAQPARKAPAVAEIPKDAVETTPGFYKWTDKDGKVWIYRRTPFGLTRRPFVAESEKQEVRGQQTIAVETGDSIRFTRATPFGKRTWMRKKAELTETEQAIWESQQKMKAASQTAEKE